jgi:signal transduction histidine kinase
VWQLLEEWQLNHWSGEEAWRQWDTRADEWLLKELRASRVETLVFVPVGSIEKPLAALFVAYANRETLGDVQKLALLTFAAALEKSHQTVTSPQLETKRTGIAVHQVLVPSTEKILAQLSAIGAHLNNHGNALRLMDDMRLGIRELRERVKRATVHDRYDLSKEELEKALKETANEFEELRPEALRINFKGVDLVEDEPLHTRQVLYQVIVEAISNAVEHGQANLVEVCIQRHPTTIVVEVVDDGSGLPREPPVDKPFGIFHLKRKLKREMNAQLDILKIEPHGVSVTLNLPLRPYRG